MKVQYILDGTPMVLDNVVSIVLLDSGEIALNGLTNSTRVPGDTDLFVFGAAS